MDKPADPATPFGEVYQSFLDDLALEGLKPSTIHLSLNQFPKGPLCRTRVVDDRAFKVEPHRRPPLEVVPGPPGVSPSHERDPRGVHRVREVLRRGVAEELANHLARA